MKKPLFYFIIVVTLLFLSACSKDSEPNKDPISNDDTIAPTIDLLIVGVDKSLMGQPITVSGQIQINVNAKDAAGIQKVEAFINNAKVGEDTAAPYELTIDLSNYGGSVSGKSKLSENAILKIVATDTNGNEAILEQEIIIETGTALITINIPEDRIRQDIVLAVVFLSRMDGSLVSFKEILKEDRQITLSSNEAFDSETEFMLSFYLQDNGGSTKISTHQNLTIKNPGIINLAVPNRWVENDLGTEIPVTNFFSNDNLFVSSGDTHHSNLWLSASARYSGFLNTDEDYLYIGHGISETNPRPFDSFYVFETYSDMTSYRYLFIDNPIAGNFTLDKNNLVDTGVETKSITPLSNIISTNQYSNILLFGARTDNDKMYNRYHLINNNSMYADIGTAMPYFFNTIFTHYKHSYLFGNYYTERNGIPKETYTIPDLTFNYTKTGNLVDLEIEGDEHILGRIRCSDFDEPNYDWYITYNSKSTNQVVIPDLPQNISHPVVTNQKNGNIVVESVELWSYESIEDYDDYIKRVTTNHRNVLEVTQWYQLIYSSESGNLNGANYEFVFF